MNVISIYISVYTYIYICVHMYIFYYTYMGNLQSLPLAVAGDASLSKHQSGICICINRQYIYLCIYCIQSAGYRHLPKKLTRVAAPSPRASLGRRTVCGRTEQLLAPVSKRYETNY